MMKKKVSDLYYQAVAKRVEYEREQARQIEEDDARDRDKVRKMLAADLKRIVPMTDYPALRDDPGEPSLEAWRMGYLKLKARDEQRILYVRMAATGIALVVAFYMPSKMFKL